MYINVKNAQKRSLATAVDEQASTNTPEATSGTAPKKRLSLSGAEVNNIFDSNSNSNSNELSLQQSEYFKGSKVRDENVICV